MKFMLIAHANKDSEAGLPPDPRLAAGIGRLIEDLASSGTLVDKGGLAPSSAGARFRVANGTVAVTDGPFAESKELVGGFVIVDVKSKEEAIEVSRRFWQLHADILGSSYVGTGELRQLADCSSSESK